MSTLFFGDAGEMAVSGPFTSVALQHTFAGNNGRSLMEDA
jgi:hypothetical protein